MAGIFFNVQHLFDSLHPKAPQGFCRWLPDPEHQQIVPQLGADQKLSGKIGHRLARVLSQGTFKPRWHVMRRSRTAWLKAR